MALLAIGMYAQQIQAQINNLPFGSDAAGAISEAVNKIRKHVPPPASTAPGVEKSQLDVMRASQQQNAMRMALQRQQQGAAGAGAGGGAPSGPPGGAGAGARPPAQMMQPSSGM